MTMPSLAPGAQSSFDAITGHHDHPDIASQLADHEARLQALETPVAVDAGAPDSPGDEQ